MKVWRPLLASDSKRESSAKIGIKSNNLASLLIGRIYILT